jgi:leucyl-tRNA synthetase
MLHGKDGDKMSKSKGNVVNPDEISKKYGMDTARIFLLSLATPEKDRDWSDDGIKGSLKLVKKIFNYFEKVKFVKNTDAKTESKLNKSIISISKGIEEFRYNLAIIKIRDLFDSLPLELSKESLEDFLKLLHPFCPHITEELWHKLGNKTFISLEKWPVADKKKINDSLERQEETIEKVIEDINQIIKLVKEKPTNAYVYILPQEKNVYLEYADLIGKKTGLEIHIFAVNDKEKYDPENKSKKAKPGKPGIYLN